MSVVVANPPLGVAEYVAWDPTARQEIEPDTTYLMDPDAEALRTLLSQDRMIAGRESAGTAEDMPPWLGGTKVAIVPGKYRKGFKCLSDTNYGFVAMPASGLLLPGQGTIEWFVRTSVDWSAQAFPTWMRLYGDAHNYITVNPGGSTIRVFYRHTQNPGVEVHRQLTAVYAGVAEEDVSLALTFDGPTMKLYVNGELAGTDGACTPPRRFWSDNWLSGTGLGVSVGSVGTVVSDVRVSRLTRVPGEVPTP